MTQEEIAALQEKANTEHHRIVGCLAELLARAAWTHIEEIPAAVDLWAIGPDGSGRVLFEVKTLSASNEVHQCRAALSQLLEYRIFYGAPSDRLCVVVNKPVTDRRRVLLEDLEIAVVVLDERGTATAAGPLALKWFEPKRFFAR